MAEKVLPGFEQAIVIKLAKEKPKLLRRKSPVRSTKQLPLKERPITPDVTTDERMRQILEAAEERSHNRAP